MVDEEDVDEEWCWKWDRFCHQRERHEVGVLESEGDW